MINFIGLCHLAIKNLLTFINVMSIVLVLQFNLLRLSKLLPCLCQVEFKIIVF